MVNNGNNSSGISCVNNSFRMVRPQMDQQFGPGQTEPHQGLDISCIRSLFANFDVENVAYMHLLFVSVRYSHNCSSNISYFLSSS